MFKTREVKYYGRKNEIWFDWWNPELDVQSDLGPFNSQEKAEKSLEQFLETFDPTKFYINKWCENEYAVVYVGDLFVQGVFRNRDMAQDKIQKIIKGVDDYVQKR